LLRFLVDILNRGLIEQAKKAHSTWKGSLNSWEKIAISATWKHPADVRLTLKSADPMGDCIVFNIAHNEARLIAFVSYPMQTLTILEVLPHKQYDKDRWKNACNC
jgi:mRNA interferase HigB